MTSNKLGSKYRLLQDDDVFNKGDIVTLVAEEWGIYSLYASSDGTEHYLNYFKLEEVIEPNYARELLQEAERIQDIALSFTHPDFSDVHPEWSEVYAFAEAVANHLENNK